MDGYRDSKKLNHFKISNNSRVQYLCTGINGSRNLIQDFLIEKLDFFFE